MSRGATIPPAESAPRSAAVPRDGMLLVDKPAGVTSHDVVMRARRSLGVKRIGHAGTLDPFATGLLVLLVGRATRLLPHLSGDPKIYDATIRFGAETSTDDLLGEITREGTLPQRDAITAAIPQLTGEIAQVPPTYSAKHVDGHRAYDLARRGVDVELKPVTVRVDAWELIAWRDSECDVRITCGGGTYVRSLARDLGRRTGSAAHLSALRRVSSGPLSVQDAISGDVLRSGEFTLRPALDALRHLESQLLSTAEVEKIARGIDVPATVNGPWSALVNSDGMLVALAEREGERWRPRVVMHDA